jgi:hypothetical protein
MNVNTKSGRDDISNVASDNRGHQVKTKEPIDTQFISRFTCLPASYSSLRWPIHLVVRELIGTTPSQGRCKNLQKMRALNVTSNPLEVLLALCWGISPRTPHKSMGRWLQTITNLCQPPQAAPSHLLSANTKNYKKTAVRTILKCH